MVEAGREISQQSHHLVSALYCLTIGFFKERELQPGQETFGDDGLGEEAQPFMTSKVAATAHGSRRSPVSEPWGTE